MKSMLLIAATLSVFVACGSAAHADDLSQRASRLLAKRCFACHGPDEDSREGGLRLDLRDSAIVEADSGKFAIVPGDAAASELLDRVRDDDENVRMPPPDHGAPLSEEEVELLRRWINAGAVYESHWSFGMLKDTQVPQGASSRNPIDAFVLKRLGKADVRPSQRADKRTLIRRVYADAIGMPPSPEEFKQFMDDPAGDAYEQLVDRVLKNQHFGERWARHWLDVARFAESGGFELDGDRPNAYQFRDFVIKAFNDDLPYHQFVQWQIAGDEYEPDNIEALKATGFLGCGVRNAVITKNQVEKERYDELNDILSTTMTAMLGLSVGCARCHDHKYDPITSTDYYRLLSTFTTTVRAEIVATQPSAEVDKALKVFERDHLKLVTELADYEKKSRNSESYTSPAIEHQPLVLSPWQSTGPLKTTGYVAGHNAVFPPEKTPGSKPDPDATWRPRLDIVDDSKLGESLIGAFPLDGDARRLPLEKAPAKVAGKVVGEASFVESPFGKAVSLDGKTGHIVVPRDETMKVGDGEFTVAAWIRPTELRQAGIVCLGRYGQQGFVFDMPNDQGVLRVETYKAANQHNGTVMSRPGAIRRDQWQHVAAVVRRDDRMTRLYVNGFEVAAGKIARWDLDDPEIHLHIGRVQGSQLFKGNIDEVRFYHRALAVAELQALIEPGRQFVVDGMSHRISQSNSVFFFHRTITAESATPTVLSFGADDTVKAWLDGELIAERIVAGAVNPDQALAHVMLPKGEHHLLVKVVNGPGIGGFYFKVKQQGLPTKIRGIARTPVAERSPQQAEKLLNWSRQFDSQWQRLSAGIASHLTQKPKYPQKTVFVSTEGRKGFRPGVYVVQGPEFYDRTYILDRGNPNSKREPATQSFLPVLMQHADNESHWIEQPPAKSRSSYRRKSLANWMTDTEHGAGSLLARVIVNRLWQHHFGQGLVTTINDFGSQGALPTHPELLEWLAGELVRNDWSLKHIHRLIMTSETFQQESAFLEDAGKIDPENRLLWRYAPRRLEGEAIRDSMLAVSGQLDRTMFGRGSLDPRQKRRSIYFTVKRSLLIPMLNLYDAPEALSSTGRRNVTTTSPQALLQINSPYVRELAEAFAARISDNANGELPTIVTRAYRHTLNRAPSQGELSAAIAFVEAQQAEYAGNGGANARPTAVADFTQAILALNEFITVD